MAFIFTSRATAAAGAHLLLAAAPVLVSTGCGPSISAQIAEADQKLSALHQAEQEQQLTCRYGPTPLPDEVREKSLAQWDAAAGDSLADCGSAWKRDPGSGVIGVEKGPLIPLV